MITRPVRERSIETIGAMVENGIRQSGFEEVGLLSLSSADHSEIAEVAHRLADRYEGTNVSLSLPSTRVDAFNITLADEFSRNGRRSGLTFAPEGGSVRMRKVINKAVDEDDLIRTVATAYSHGWRQVKLYFMCGLPTETDDDVLEIADLAKKVIAKGREVTGHNDIRCTVSIGGFVPKPHTPFQWAAQLDHDTTDERLKKLRDLVRADKRYGRAIGFRYHDGKPGTIEGLLSRGDRRVGAVIEQVWRDGGRFDGWSEHFSYDRWVAACERALERHRRGPRLVHPPRARLRRGAAVGPPRLRSRQGLALGGLGGRPQGRGRPRLRPRGRRLPLDAVLRLRRLPRDGHRDPDRPDRPLVAPSQRGGDHLGAVADLPAAAVRRVDVGADLDHLSAGDLVTDGARGSEVLVAVVEDLHVGAAGRAVADAELDLVRAALGLGDLLEPHVLRCVETQCLHVALLLSPRGRRSVRGAPSMPVCMFFIGNSLLHTLDERKTGQIQRQSQIQ